MFSGAGFQAQLSRLGKNLVFRHSFSMVQDQGGIEESFKAPRHQEIIANFWKFRLRCSKYLAFNEKQ